MGSLDTVFGKFPILRGRGTIGTSQVNLNPLAVALRWSSVFDIGYVLDVSSSNAADAAAGTGARIIRIAGLDDAYNRIYEDVTLNGQTKVTTAKKFKRVLAAYVKTAGTGLVNAGDIYIVKGGTGGTYTGGVPGTLTSAVIKMLAGNNLGFSGLFTVPAGCYYKANAIFGSARAQAGTIVVLRGNASLSEFAGPFESLKLEVSNDAGTASIAGIVLNPKDDIYMQAFAAAAGGIVNCTIDLEQLSGPLFNEV